MQYPFGALGRIYGIIRIIFFLIDLIRIGVLAKGFYARRIGRLLGDMINWPAAMMFS
jgi:uncharacterized membrane protein